MQRKNIVRENKAEKLQEQSRLLARTAGRRLSNEELVQVSGGGGGNTSLTGPDSDTNYN